MEYIEVTRRNFLIGFTKSVAAFLSAGAAFFSSCDRKNKGVENRSNPDVMMDPCDDLSGVSKNELALRQKLAYVKVSPIDDNRCDNCNLFLPRATEKKCGDCILFKGPVYNSGYCTYWAPKV